MSRDLKGKINRLMLHILQDYFEIMMKSKYGDEWIKKVITVCETKASDNNNAADSGKTTNKGKTEKKSSANTYKKIVEKKRKFGEKRITKRNFDVTLLNAFLQFDFPKDCSPISEYKEIETFKHYIDNIREDKNEYISHDSDPDYDIKEHTSASGCIYNLNEFIEYLEDYSWAAADKEREEFIRRYKKEVKDLFKELTDGKTKQNVSVPVRVAVKDSAGNPVPGCSLRIVNSSEEMVSDWISSQKDFFIRLDRGRYRVEVVGVPDGYKDIASVPFLLEDVEEKIELPAERSVPDGRISIPDNGRSITNAERSLTDNELYVRSVRDLDKQPSDSLSMLEELEKKNHMESLLFLSFLLKTGLYVEKDLKKAGELLHIARLREDESEWFAKATRLKDEKKYEAAVAYYLGSSMNGRSGEGYFLSGRIFIKRVKNYELCRECFGLAKHDGIADAEKHYEYTCDIGKEEFMKI